MVVDIRFEIRKRGPIFNGQAEQAVDEFVDELRETVAHEAWRTVTGNMAIFKQPTGYYEGHTIVTRRLDSNVVHDAGVVYGPWLEGVSARNRTSRFKGYRLWRRGHQETLGRVTQIADDTIGPYLRRAGGR